TSRSSLGPPPLPRPPRRRGHRRRVIALLLIAIALIAALSGPVTPSADAADSKGPKTLLGSIFGSSGRQDGHEEEERLDPDRPHFPEATTTVGKGRVILESGYTFTEKRSSFSSQTYRSRLSSRRSLWRSSSRCSPRSTSSKSEGVDFQQHALSISSPADPLVLSRSRHAGGADAAWRGVRGGRGGSPSRRLPTVPASRSCRPT